MRLLRVALLTGLLALLGVFTAQAQSVPRLEPADCQFETSFGQDVTCFNFYVREDRSNPQSPEIRLHVALFKSYSDNPLPDPVVFLDGGPGSNALEKIGPVFGFVFAPFAENRDFIIFDQRGTGFSQPRLGCPEYDNMRYDTLDDALSRQDLAELTIEAMRVCQARLESRGIDLSAYNSASNARDLDELRQALGYEQWNLYGISYGTRLALTAMRDTPDGIRSVIIDSVLPPQVSLFDETAGNAERALNQLFLYCTLDEECNRYYPLLGTVFYEVVEQLNREPAQAKIVHPNSNREYDVLIDGDLLTQLAFGSLYSVNWIEQLPKVIYDTRDGNYLLLSQVLQSILYDSDGWAMGMHFSVQCNEEAPFTSVNSLRASVEQFPQLSSYVQSIPNISETTLTICEAWDTVEPDPIENMPVFSDIPTLVMSGQYDPITPPHWGRLTASTLPLSHFYEYPGVGHGATVEHSCGMNMALEFLDSPGVPPDAACIAEMEQPEFLTVDNSIWLVSFTDEFSGIASVRPEGWVEIYPGEFSRSQLDSASISFQVYPEFELRRAATLIAQEFDVYRVDDPFDSRAAGGLNWVIFRFSVADTLLSLALTQRGEDTYAVALVSQRNEHDALYETLLLPALEAFRIL